MSPSATSVVDNGDNGGPPIQEEGPLAEVRLAVDVEADASDDALARVLVADLHAYGVCALDAFAGRARGLGALQEVLDLQAAGAFGAGELVRADAARRRHDIRSDRIAWVSGAEPHCANIAHVMRRLDALVARATQLARHGPLAERRIRGRTKAMVACYPGFGTHYVKHVDNPNKDGRCITAIYYLNLDWDVRVNGGLLRIYPEGWKDQVANIEPLFDRVLFFWSDRRNPHEVQPAYNTRYAITLWYFDAIEKEEACKRLRNERLQKASLQSQ